MVPFPQTGLLSKFGRGSCYLFSLARAFEILTDTELRAEDVLFTGLRSKNISSNAFVYDAGGFLEELRLLPSISIGGNFAVTKEMQASSLPDVCNIQHWLYSGNGYTAHHFKLDDWDPLYDKSQAERLGKIVDYRVVSLTANE